jgi:tetratricopeptide (TPR) repeat protein
MKSPIAFTLMFALGVFAFAVCPACAYSSDAVVAYQQGLSLIDVGNYTGAVQAFDYAIALEPTYFEAWNGKADAFNRAAQFTDALNASDQALAINPQYVMGWINHGYILYNLGRYQEELEAYDRAIAIDPNNATAWFDKGYALGGDEKKWDEALQAFSKVQALDPNYPNLQANINIAQQNLDASTPLYVKYAPAIVATVVIVAGAGFWLYAVRKKY